MNVRMIATVSDSLSHLDAFSPIAFAHHLHALFLFVIHWFSWSHIFKFFPLFTITHNQKSIISVKWSMSNIFTMSGCDQHFNRDILITFKIHPPSNLVLPNHIIIDLWLITHTNAASSGFRFNCIAEYGVVFFMSTWSPCLVALIGA